MNPLQKKAVLNGLGMLECCKVGPTQYSASFYRIVSRNVYTAVSHSFGKTECEAVARVYTLVNRWLWNEMF